MPPHTHTHTHSHVCPDRLAWCWSVRRGCILELKGRIDRDSAFASSQLPLSIVTGRLGPLMELCTFLPEEPPLCKGSIQINLRHLWFKKKNNNQKLRHRFLVAFFKCCIFRNSFHPRKRGRLLLPSSALQQGPGADDVALVSCVGLYRSD